VLWKVAVGLVLTCVLAGMAPAATPAPVKLAVFPFELDDFSAAISTGNPDPADMAELARVTEDVRKLLQESGRYDLVSVAGAEAKSLRDCNGCDAPLAAQLGAQQSFVGVVKRISRAEYQVHFQLRDAATGALIAEADTGLRMGAMDSWNRGALRLVKDRLLKNPG
jgi:hypothetical protein